MSELTTPEPKREIFAAISRVMADIGAVGKDRRNPQQGYQFRGIDDVYNAVHAAFAKHGVFVVPEVIEKSYEERQSKSGGVMFRCLLTIRHRFYASDGSHVDAVTIGESMDTSDKATNKCMSNAMKYALLEVLAIPTEELKDAENEHPEAGPRVEQSHGRRAQRVANSAEKRPPNGAGAAPENEGDDPLVLEVRSLIKAIGAAPNTVALEALLPRLKALPDDDRKEMRGIYAARKVELGKLDPAHGTDNLPAGMA